jgi:Rod binding domain-containing protein
VFKRRGNLTLVAVAAFGSRQAGSQVLPAFFHKGRNRMKIEQAPASPPEKFMDPALQKAAEGLEALFVEEMLKAMRASIPSSDMDLESPATKIYRSQLDGEVAKMAAGQRQVGLAEQMIKYLGG